MFGYLSRLSDRIDRTMVRFLFALFLAISIICVLGGIALAAKKIILLAKASRATAKVVAHHLEQDGDIKPLPQPILVFTNAIGQTHTVTQQATTIFHNFPIGAAVPVLYDPQNPADAEIYRFSLVFFAPVFLITFGTIGGAFILLWRLLFRRFRGW